MKTRCNCSGTRMVKKKYRDNRGEVEEKLERMVMGKGYDAWKEGKLVGYDIGEGVCY